MKPIIPALLVLALSPVAFAATFPYANNFDGTGSNTAFTVETIDSQWSVSGGRYINTFSTTTSSNSTASISVTGVPGNSFTISSKFTVTAASIATGSTDTHYSTVGFGFLANSTDFSSTSNTYYLADFAYASASATSPNLGTLRILSPGTGNADVSSANASAFADGAASRFAVVINTTYTLKLTGTYSTEGVLTMTLGLFDADGTTSIGGTATASDATPLTGTSFGYRNRIAAPSSSSTTIAFDDFGVVAIPEPSSFTLVAAGLSLAACLVFRRRA